MKNMTRSDANLNYISARYHFPFSYFSNLLFNIFCLHVTVYIFKYDPFIFLLKQAVENIIYEFNKNPHVMNPRNIQQK